ASTPTRHPAWAYRVRGDARRINVSARSRARSTGVSGTTDSMLSGGGGRRDRCARARWHGAPPILGPAYAAARMIAGPADRPEVRLFVTDIVPQQADHGVQRLMILGQPCFGLSSLVTNR